MSAHDKITSPEAVAIRLHIYRQASVWLEPALPPMDPATMAAIQLGRIPPFTPSGAQVAK